MRKAVTILLAAIIAGCTPVSNQTEIASAPQVEEAAPSKPITILISIDGFHPDYLDRGLTPTLARLASTGVTGPMRPSFPTKTFPNHWTMVTGLVPDQHGITANRIEDSRRPDEVFTMSNVDPWWWAEAKPIWVEAEQAGIRTANMFWPGSAVPWGGRPRPFGPAEGGTMSSDWVPFSMQVNNVQRVNTVLDWARRPDDLRPRFITLYFDTIDTAGHGDGTSGEMLDAALVEIDGNIASLVDGLVGMAQPANLVITSDHGMAPTSSERMIGIDELLEPDSFRMIESGAYATFEATEGNQELLETRLLADHDHMTCWRKEEIPARYQYGSHPRIPPYFCLPETGWTIAAARSPVEWSGGNHGYDPFDPAMMSLFIAHGPAFGPGVEIGEFQNTAIAPLLRHLIGLPGQSSQQDAKAVFGPALIQE